MLVASTSSSVIFLQAVFLYIIKGECSWVSLSLTIPTKGLLLRHVNTSSTHPLTRYRPCRWIEAKASAWDFWQVAIFSLHKAFHAPSPRQVSTPSLCTSWLSWATSRLECAACHAELHARTCAKALKTLRVVTQRCCLMLHGDQKASHAQFLLSWHKHIMRGCNKWPLCQVMPAQGWAWEHGRLQPRGAAWSLWQWVSSEPLPGLAPRHHAQPGSALLLALPCTLRQHRS